MMHQEAANNGGSSGDELVTAKRAIVTLMVAMTTNLVTCFFGVHNSKGGEVGGGKADD